jgi:RNA polymerase sigma factor (TIGR02999 family)
MKPAASDVTALLQAWSGGDESARDQLFPLVYDELRRRAAGHLRRERPGHTLQTSGLVHEAFLKLIDQNAGWKNRAQFFGIASQVMRRVLVDHARARQAAKRAGPRIHVTLGEEVAVSDPREVDLIELDAALDELAAIDPRQARIVELRFFGGLTQQEVADLLGISLTTANREWRLVKAWLYQRISSEA